MEKSQKSWMIKLKLVYKVIHTVNFNFFVDVENLVNAYFLKTLKYNSIHGLEVIFYSC